ncbi:flagellar basal body rod C-terminal domain-containing protein [Brevundimonas vesicularis]|uniref:flagellar basal body rod C-terminal domain-containing protein n=1 Tax=Brevundimonas vesicularis TaxID=41276 RepID=UPI0038D4BCF3
MLNAINLAQVGLVNASVRLDASARRTVETTIDARAVEPVEQIIATQQFSANTATVRTADQMLGTLLDIRA